MVISTENTGINPVIKVMPVLPVAAIGDPLQVLSDRATQFSKGQDYIAHVTAKLNDTTFLVKVEQSTFQMKLGTTTQVGQNLLLKYIQDTPAQAFALLSAKDDASLTHQNTGVMASLSLGARLIEQSFKHVESTQFVTKVESQVLVTKVPNNPMILAQDLKNAVSNSGLFYESHLSEYAQGLRTLLEIQQEPQNRGHIAAANFISQQLSVLENQRISWHGEVWPGQAMQWSIALPNEQQSTQHDVDEAKHSTLIASDLTLEMPNLGRVTAKLSLMAGRMQISFNTTSPQTAALLKAQSANLAYAIRKNGQVLEGLSVLSDGE